MEGKRVDLVQVGVGEAFDAGDEDVEPVGDLRQVVLQDLHSGSFGEYFDFFGVRSAMAASFLRGCIILQERAKLNPSAGG